MSLDVDLVDAFRAAHLQAAKLGNPLLDDRILFAYGRVAEPLIEAAVREKVAQEIEAHMVALHSDMFADPTRDHISVAVGAAIGQAAAIARGGQVRDPMWQPQTPDIRPAAAL